MDVSPLRLFVVVVSLPLPKSMVVVASTMVIIFVFVVFVLVRTVTQTRFSLARYDESCGNCSIISLVFFVGFCVRDSRKNSQLVDLLPLIVFSGDCCCLLATRKRQQALNSIQQWKGRSTATRQNNKKMLTRPNTRTINNWNYNNTEWN